MFPALAPEYQVIQKNGKFLCQKKQGPCIICKNVQRDQSDQDKAKGKRDAVGQDPSGYWRSRPIAPATSAMRQEKPHSLSYQASTRTVRLPTTFVWSGAKIDECVV
jgi:hypothetical protein